MRITVSTLCCLVAAATKVVAAAEWAYKDASVTVSAKGAGVGGGEKQSLSVTSKAPVTVTLGNTDTLKLILTATEDSTGKRPHQAFLTLHDPVSGLAESFPLNVKENGKSKLDISHKDIPIQLLTSPSPIQGNIVLASFGSSTPFLQTAFLLGIAHDASAPIAPPSAPLRYGKLEEIRHIFRTDPKSPPFVISSVFTLAVVAALPVLLGAWVALGANVDHLSTAISAAPVSHALFLGSIVALEGLFFLYYTTWNLFQTLPVAVLLGVVTLLSGSRALTEVQERRLKGER